MSSERPRTPTRSTFGYGEPPSSAAAAAAKNPAFEISTPTTGYVPRLHNLIYPLKDAVGVVPQYIPSIFLGAEAVDSAVLLGHGASFSASLQRIPEGPKRIEVTTQLEGWSVTKSIPAPPRPDYIVYKVARIAFTDDGQALPEYRKALDDFLTEIHALIYPPLFQHENIINFLGFAWGSNPFSSVHKLPAIILEFAQHGTLADLLSKTQLNYDMKHTICLDIARGLLAVHRAGLVHGDVKAENVLICSSEDRNYVGKIADFGYSVVESTESTEIWIGGTRPWKAPETQRPLPVKSLSSTDIYSLGLLIWLVCIDGGNPFDLIIDSSIRGASRVNNIEALKQSDQLNTLARGKHWLRVFLARKFEPQLGTLIERARRDTLVLDSGSSLTPLTARCSKLPDSLLDSLSKSICQKRLMRSLDDIFEHSIQMDPERRSLDVLVALLESDETPRVSRGKQTADERPESKTTYSITNHSNETKYFKRTSGSSTPSKVNQEEALQISGTDVVSQAQTSETTKHFPKNGTKGVENPGPTGVSAAVNTEITEKKPNCLPLPSWSRRGYKSDWMSWQKTRDLEPSVQTLIFDFFPTTNGMELFVLAALHMNGYGCEANDEEALRCLQKAVDLGAHNSRAYMYRIFTACTNRVQHDNPGYKFLEDYANIGSRAALEELQEIGPKEKADAVLKWLGDTSGGVGADWYSKDEMLHGFTQSQWMKDDWTLQYIRKAEPLPNIVVNKRGDTILHLVASCGRWKPLQSLINDHKIDINLRNFCGETPLLCACRAGQGGIAIVCLQRFKANASIAANNGETPLHWLSSFQDEYIDPLAHDLFTNGAGADAMTNERVTHSRFGGTIDVDFKTPGTPLSWAVHSNRPHVVKILLKHGADPNGSVEEQRNKYGPLEHAAYYHRDECLRIMIEHLEEKLIHVSSEGKPDLRRALEYGPVVRSAVHAADKFSMILRNGKQYLRALHSTLDLLREKSQLINFQGQFKGSLLYYAVSEAHDEVVEYMFEKNWLLKTLNASCGDAHMTPLLEAIHWNRRSMYQILFQHGADINALAGNPFQPEVFNWSALHILAYEGHNKDVAFVKDLVTAGLPIDGSPDAPASVLGVLSNSTATTTSPDISRLSVADSAKSLLPCETPFAVAVRHNAFHLASTLLSFGANPNALTFTSGLFASPYPATVLGHIIIANARHSSARLRYLLDQSNCLTTFVVEPTRQLSALHRAAMAHQSLQKVNGGAVRREEFDFDTNADIMHELLLKWKEEDNLNSACSIHGNTAVHLAIEAGNLGGLDSLLRVGASTDIRNSDGETALQLAKRLASTSKDGETILSRLS